jgi:hypothetical protein
MNFRKYINVFLVLFLLASNLGLSYNVHYCDDEVASITLNTKSHEIEKDCCGVMEKKSKCCKNKLVKSNEKSAQIQAKTISLDAEYNFVFKEWRLENFSENFNFQPKKSICYYCDAHAPPLYLLYSQYTFYS